MQKLRDLTGQRFGRLVALSYAGKYRWNCRCDCGNTSTVLSGNLRAGTSKSCGCMIGKASTHGQTDTPTYHVWRHMLARCTNSNHPAWADYGGRGIKVCTRWFQFENFFADMGERPKGLTIERIHNDRDYEPDNCCWATQKEQCRNRRNSRIVTIDDKTMTIAAHAERMAVPYSTLYNRLARRK